MTAYVSFRKISVILFSFFTSILFLTSCSKKEKIVKIDPAFSKYISEYTSGVISKAAVIRIRLADGINVTHTLGEIKDKKLFEFSPSVSGKAYWLDASTIEFRPGKNLEAGALYTITFQLGKVATVPDKFKDFTFNATVTTPAFTINEEGLRSSGDKETMFLPGTIETADIENDKDIEAIVSASHNQDKLVIAWQHDSANRIHHFTINGIHRNSLDDGLLISWDGSTIGSKTKGKLPIVVPAMGKFTLLQTRAVQEGSQYISVQFSDPVSITQDITGLITISDQANSTYAINGSEVKIFPSEELEGDYTVNVNSGIQNKWNTPLGQSFVSNVSFYSTKPSVKIEGRGNILPHDKKLTLPFTTINLNAVDVSIIKVYENKIPQFLQSNGYESDNGLRQVATPIVQQTIRLDDDKSINLHKKQRFVLDIDKFLKTEPGAIYRIVIGFRPEYSLYDCKEKANEEESPEDEYEDYSYEDSPDDQQAFWARYDNYYPYGYNWKQRDNPCFASYYSKERFAFRNIIASNIGIIAHRGTLNDLQVTVTDMLTANPLADADIKVLDYQEQIVGNGKSDKNGMVTITCKRKPFLIVVSQGREKGYLKVDDGSSLPLSRFDIAGEEIQKGIKGMIFGERGVWRPGDSLFISFIEEDIDHRLPTDHPIEFELYNSHGQLYHRMVQKNQSGGYNVFKLKTTTDVPTGNWKAKVMAGGATFEKTIRIETVMPNRLSIQVDFGNDTILGKNHFNQGTLKSSWLFGAPASGLKATVDLSLTPINTSFKKFRDFSFNNPVTDATFATTTIFKGELNAEGKAPILAKVNSSEGAAGMMKATLFTKVFEPGGAFSVQTTSLPYSPFTSYAGLKLPEGEKPWGFLTTGDTHTVSIVNVDEFGNLIHANRQVEISLYKIQWRWWWDNSGETFSNFTQDKYNKLISHQILETVNGKLEWSFKVPWDDWGRYLVLVKDIASGHTTGDIMYLDNASWRSRENTNDPTAASMLSFTSDNSTYNSGDNITLIIPGSDNGRGLVTITTGSKVLKSWWINTHAGNNYVKFKAEEGWAPNVYAQVSLLQPYAQTVNDLPMRMYGVIPLIIQNKETLLQPEINIPDVIRPEQRTSITVSEKNNREMWYSIAIVDNGLLDLTNFKTPNPHDYFFAREALSVRVWDIFDYVIGAWGANLERILTIGGDQEANGPVHQKEANRFKPVVLFLGPFKLEKGKKDIKSFTLPQYAGSVRVMVVAAGNNAYGSTQKSVAVKKPLMMLATLPRILSPGETTKIPVTVFATENNIRTVNVRLQTNPLFEITSSATQTLEFKKSGEQTLFFEVKVRDQSGIGKISLLASGGNDKAGYEGELDIRNPNPFITDISTSAIDKGKSSVLNLKSIGRGVSSTAVIELSTLPPIDLQKHLDFLIDYPHGCAEQTVSRVFAQLYLSNLTELSTTQKSRIDQNIKAGINALQNFQSPDGGFAYWPGDRQSDEWATSYAGHFLLKAQSVGYAVPAWMIQQWKSFQASKAANWAPSTTQFYGADLNQAYRLFVLALAKSPDIGAMNRLKEFQYISPEARWRLAAAYQLTGQSTIANQLISGLPVSFAHRDMAGITYGSSLRDEAMILETLTLMDKRTRASDILKSVAAQLSSDAWYSTQTTAYALLSVAEFIGGNGTGEKISASVRINGKDFSLNSQKYVESIPVAFTNQNADISIRNSGSGVLFVRTINKGKPITGETIRQINHPDLLNMKVSFLTSDQKPLDIGSLYQGTDFIMKVSVTNPGKRADYRRMALTQIVPAGWEILNTRLFEGAGTLSSSSMQYRDIRDDRVYTYFDLNPGETKTYYVNLTAAYTGRYYFPPVVCNSMYNQEIQAVSGGRWVQVMESGKSSQ